MVCALRGNHSTLNHESMVQMFKSYIYIIYIGLHSTQIVGKKVAYYPDKDKGNIVPNENKVT